MAERVVLLRCLWMTTHEPYHFRHSGGKGVVSFINWAYNSDEYRD
jgi:hypothetical protein